MTQYIVEEGRVASPDRAPAHYSPEVQRYRDHLDALAEQHGVLIVEGVGAPRESAAAAKHEDGTLTLLLPEIDHETAYAVGLHEMGHLIDPRGTPPAHIISINHLQQDPQATPLDWYQVLDAEVAAWDWAVAHALHWTTAMEQVRQFATGTYVEACQRVQKALDL